MTTWLYDPYMVHGMLSCADYERLSSSGAEGLPSGCGADHEIVLEPKPWKETKLSPHLNLTLYQSHVQQVNTWVQFLAICFAHFIFCLVFVPHLVAQACQYVLASERCSYHMLFICTYLIFLILSVVYCYEKKQQLMWQWLQSNLQLCKCSRACVVIWGWGSLR